jgi:hypothetical protein
VKVIIEQVAREGPCPECGVVSGTVKDRPLPASVVQPDRDGGAAAGAGN